MSPKKMWNIFKRTPATLPEQQFNIEPWEIQTRDKYVITSYEYRKFYKNLKTPLTEAIENDDSEKLSDLLKTLPANELFLFMDVHEHHGTKEWATKIKSLDEDALFRYVSDWLTRTDWFSAAVYMQSEKCIKWAINSGHVTINRNVAQFFVSEGIQNEDIKTFKSLCFSGQVSDFSKYITQENLLYWTQTKNLKTIPGSTDWLKCKLFEATAYGNNRLTSNSFENWMSNEALKNPPTLSVNMNTVFGCLSLGCEPIVFLEIMDWLKLRCDPTNTNFHEFNSNIEHLCLENKFKSDRAKHPSQNMTL